MTSAELIEISRPKLELVHPKLRSLTETIIDLLVTDYGLCFGVHMGLRTFEVQDALYAQGRMSLGAVNLKRQLAGLGEISETENKKRVTKAPAGKSFHNYGLAVDLVEDGNPDNAGIQWSWDRNMDYLTIGKVVKAFPELSWGGFWKSLKDFPHIEMRGGLTEDSALILYKAGGLSEAWAAVDEDLRLKRVA